MGGLGVCFLLPYPCIIIYIYSITKFPICPDTWGAWDLRGGGPGTLGV